jgi:hypothetical protein
VGVARRHQYHLLPIAGFISYTNKLQGFVFESDVESSDDLFDSDSDSDSNNSRARAVS